MAADPVQVADVVLGQAAAPAGDPLRDASCCYPRGVGELGGGEGRQVRVVALQHAVSPMRPTEQRTTCTGACAARCGHLTVENVAALTARPSTAGTR